MMCNLYAEKAYYRKNIKNMTNGKAEKCIFNKKQQYNKKL